METLQTIRRALPLLTLYCFKRQLYHRQKPGATATNFTSFSAVAQCLSNCGISGPVTFTVAPGSGPYNEVIILPNISGTSATNTITFNGNGNTVSEIRLTGNDGVVKLNGAKFIRFNNLKFDNQGINSASPVVLMAYQYEQYYISGCTLTNNINSTQFQYGA